MKKIILKLAGWILFSFFSLSALGILSTVFFLSVWLKDANFMKLAVLDFIIILVGLVVFVLGLGILEFVLSFIKVETELAEIEDILPKIEEEVGLLPGGPRDGKNQSNSKDKEKSSL